MNILFATLGYKPAYKFGGPIVSVAALAEILSRRGHKVSVYTSNSNLDESLNVPVNKPQLVNGVNVWYFEQMNPFSNVLGKYSYSSKSVGYLYLPLLKPVLEKTIKTFDLVHTHMPFVYPTYAVGRVAINNKVPLFYQQRGAFAPGYMNFRGLKKRIYIALFEKILMNKAISLIALSEEEVTSYRKIGVKTTCRIVPNGVNVQEYYQNSDDHLFVTNDQSIKPADIVILFLARLHAIKGSDFLLNVFLELFQKYSNAKLILAGPDQHGYHDSFLKKIRQAGAYDRIILPGMVTGDKKNRLLARADLFCLPSSAEGFSVSVLEAMASQTPVLITPECNFSSIEKYRAGWVVPKDMKAWVGKISYLLENPNELCIRGKNAFNLVKDNYSWENSVDNLEAAYSEGLSRAGANSQNTQ